MLQLQTIDQAVEMNIISAAVMRKPDYRRAIPQLYKLMDQKQSFIFLIARFIISIVLLLVEQDMSYFYTPKIILT